MSDELGRISIRLDQALQQLSAMSAEQAAQGTRMSGLEVGLNEMREDVRQYRADERARRQRILAQAGALLVAAIGTLLSPVGDALSRLIHRP